MLLEKIIFNTLSFILLIIVFFRIVKRNDTNYVYLLVLESIGIIASFFELMYGINLHFAIKVITYLLSIIIPIIILLLEKKGILFSEILIIGYSNILMKFGNNKKAKAKLINLVQKYEYSHIAHIKLAKIYEKEEKYEIASDEYAKAIEAKQDDYNSYISLANNLKRIDKQNEAINTLNILLSRNPENLEASSLLGDILYEQERYKESVNVYLEALKYNKDCYELYYSLGMSYTMLNDFALAKEYYSKAAKINTLLNQANYNLGQIAMIYGDLDEAETYFLQASKNENSEIGSYYYLAQISMLKGNEQNAINYINVVIDLNPNMYETIQREVIFLPIRNKINKPDKKEVEKRKSTLSKKEKNVTKHLAKTYEIVGKLNNHDIKVMQNIKEKNKQDRQRE